MTKIEILICQNYLPFNTYLTIIYNLLIANNYNVSIINNINNHKKDVNYLILFLNNIKNIYNELLGNTKIIFIHADYLLCHSIEDQTKMKNYINNINPDNSYIWEYNSLNCDYYEKNFTNKKFFFIPLEYSFYLENMYKSTKIPYDKKDIDILFLGSINERRQLIINQLQKKYRVCVYNNINDIDEYCNIIERSKIVLNIYSKDINKPFDYYRLALLYSNKIFVISEQPEHLDLKYQNNLLDVLNSSINVNYDDIINKIDECLKIESDEINKIVEDTYKTFKKCNMDVNIINFFKTIDLKN
jgi:hypothetical protein